MIWVSFFFSQRALPKKLSRNGIGLKVTKFDDTNRQTDKHFLFNIKGSITFRTIVFVRYFSYGLFVQVLFVQIFFVRTFRTNTKGGGQNYSPRGRKVLA